jgi:hypothetical protein
MTMRRLVEVAVFAFAFALGWFAAGGTVELAWLYVSYVAVRLEYQRVMFGPNFFLEIAATVAALVLVALFALAAPALAQGQAKNARAADERFAAPGFPRLPDPLGLNKGAGTTGTNPFDNLTDDVLKKILADVTYAKALAKASGNDVTLQCWSAWVDLTTAQTQPVKDDAGNELTMPEPHFFVAAERASEFINQIQPNSKLNIACGAALNASKMAIGQLIGAVLSGGALGLFKLPLP